MDEKELLLAELASARRAVRSELFFNISQFHAGRYDCPFVSPWTKGANNRDADLMIVGLDWASEDFLKGPFDAELAKLGRKPSLPTNRNLNYFLANALGLEFRDCYATNSFPFVKPGGMSGTGGLPLGVWVTEARRFLLPQIKIVRPRVVVLLGLQTANVVRSAYGLSKVDRQDAAIASEFMMFGSRALTMPHPGVFGVRSRGGVEAAL